MNLHQLQVFHTVARRLSISEAAYHLRLTQPAVSQQVKALEREFGLHLIERGGKQLRLTQAGEALHQCAASIIHATDEAERAISELRHATKGKLVLATNTTGGMYLLPRIVRAFRAQHPEAEIVLHIEHTAVVFERILQSAVDMGLVGGPIEDRRFGVEPICVDQLALIVSPSHPFARLPAVKPKALENGVCIAAQQVSRTRQFVDRKLRDIGVTLRVLMELPSTEAVKKAVEANLGFAVVSGFSVEGLPADATLRVIPLKGVDLRRNMELIYRKQKYFSPVAQHFREFVHTYTHGHLSRATGARVAKR